MQALNTKHPAAKTLTPSVGSSAFVWSPIQTAAQRDKENSDPCAEQSVRLCPWTACWLDASRRQETMHKKQVDIIRNCRLKSGVQLEAEMQAS